MNDLSPPNGNYTPQSSERFPVFSATKVVAANMDGQFFRDILLDTVVIDTAGSFVGGNFVAKQSGTYAASGVIRFVDGSAAAISYGLGIDTNIGDGPNFVWGQSNAARNGLGVSRLMQLNANDVVHLVSYWGAAGLIQITFAKLDIYRIR